MNDDEFFKSLIVRLILSKKTEIALEFLSKHYGVEKPKLKVGMPKGRSKYKGCYLQKTKAIHVSSQDVLYNPYVILHEFYHHLRIHDGVHRGTEKNANRFARWYIEAYMIKHDSDLVKIKSEGDGR
ncbi:MAG: hypothetical protein ACUVTD_03225 [Nitrososphaerales archaeon]